MIINTNMLKAEREKRNLTLDELAEQLNSIFKNVTFTKSQLSKIENNQIQKLSYLKMLSDFYSIDLSKLIEYEKNDLHIDTYEKLEFKEPASTKKETDSIKARHHSNLIKYKVCSSTLTTIHFLNSSDYIEISKSLLHENDENLFCYKIDSDEINNIIQEKSVILCNKFKNNFKFIANGDIVLIKINGEVHVREFYKDSKRNRYLLKENSNNKLNVDIIVTSSDFIEFVYKVEQSFFYYD